MGYFISINKPSEDGVSLITCKQKCINVVVSRDASTVNIFPKNREEMKGALFLMGHGSYEDF